MTQGRKMNKNGNKDWLTQLLTGVLMLVVCSSSFAATPEQIDDARNKGLAWLLQNQNGDGSWGNGSGSSVRGTSSAIKAFENAGLRNFSYARGISYLANTSPSSTDSLARKIDALQSTGIQLDSDVNRLVGISDDGITWGAYAGYGASSPDTSLAFTVLRNHLIDKNDPQLFARYVDGKGQMCEQYLPPHADAGGWSWAPSLRGDDTVKTSGKAYVLPTSYALLDLILFQSQNTSEDFRLCLNFITQNGEQRFIQQSIDEGVEWLINNKLNPDGGFSDEGESRVLDTTLVYKVLSLTRPTDPATIGAVDYLLAQQAAGGSWSSDPFVSAEILASFPPKDYDDEDGDGIPDSIELVIGSNPQSHDSRSLLASNGNAVLGATSPFSYSFPFNTFNSQQLSVSGGVAPYAWSVIGGELPPGITLTSSGSLEGTAIGAGVYNFTYTILDANGLSATAVAQINVSAMEIQFASSTYAIDESGATIDVDVVRSNASGSYAVNYATLDGTSVSSSDYVATSGTLSFADGEVSKSISISIIDDTIVEGKEIFSILLSSPTGGAVIGSIGTANLVINDTEAGQFELVQPAVPVKESDGQITLRVNRIDGDRSNATLNFATIDGSAIGGSDFVAASGVLEFKSNEITKTITIQILGDSVLDDNETFQVQIFNPTNGSSLGQSNLAVVTIENSDSLLTANNLNSSTMIEEDGGAQSLPVIQVADNVVGRIITAELTVQTTEAGELSTNDGATYDSNTGLWSFSGTMDEVNQALANVTFTPVGDWDQNLTVTTKITDAIGVGPDDGEWKLTISPATLKSFLIEKSVGTPCADDIRRCNPWNARPTLSDDGNYMSFSMHSSADVNGKFNLYRYDFLKDELISENDFSSFPVGAYETNAYLEHKISNSGQQVRYTSYHTDGTSMIVSRDFDSGEWQRLTPVSDGSTIEKASGFAYCYDTQEIVFNNLKIGVTLTSDAYLNETYPYTNPYLYNLTENNIEFLPLDLNFNGNSSNIRGVSSECTKVLAQVNNVGTVLYDRTTSEIINFPAVDSSISQSGNVVFYSYRDQLGEVFPEDTNNYHDIAYYDVVTGEHKRISAIVDGQQSNGRSILGFNGLGGSSVSSTGRYFVFQSTANNLVEDDLSTAGYYGLFNIFLYDRLLDKTTLISRNLAGIQGNANNFSPAISGDGSTIAYMSSSTNWEESEPGYKYSRLYIYKRGGAKPDAPVATPAHIAVDNINTEIITDLNGTDVDTGDSIVAYRIDSLPLNGTLLLNGNAVTIGQNVSQTEMDAGVLTYTAVANYIGSDTFTYSAKDSTGLYSIASATVFLSISERDVAAPIVSQPPDIILIATGYPTIVSLGIATAENIAGDALPVVNDAPSVFQLGTTIVTWSATDLAGNTGSAVQLVTISSGNLQLETIDTDGDGISDGNELYIYGTSNLLKDTDNDEINDDVEISNGTNPMVNEAALMTIINTLLLGK